ncbi:alpha/beta fold hydrolase [Stappia sp. ES.058]|uniref:alpha/beta fold hydrolase n=1 Tax=Stappia sp. ES.058 TaxID=1881061 RepID=UPI00087C1A65|nr:alpha/beta hydrolase [Stappia sp. ES.058]SDU22139.1 Pimeloyl-ACP methyl ester carboxylesterase [Stappia sp. ES.058]
MSGRQIELAGADGNRLIADVFGERGRPALLLHGGGQTRHAWDATGARLAKAGMLAWSLDQRGHGDSDWVEDGGYRFEDFGRDVVAVADRLAEQTGSRPIAIGASLGGIASLLAEGALKPGTLSALVLVDITPRMDPSGVNKIISFMSERMHDGFASVEEAADAIASYLPHRSRPKSLEGLSKNLRQHADGRYRWHWDPRFIEQRHGRDAEEPGPIEAKLVSAAKALDIPVLLVRGARSELVTDAHVDEFLTLVPHAQYADVKGAGHMVAGDRNDAFAGAVVSFLDRLKAA